MQKNFLIILLTVFIDFIGVGLVIPIFAPLFLSNTSGLFEVNTPENVRNALLGLTLATFPFFQFFGAPILGALSDKFGRKKILFISILGTFVGYVLMVVGITHQNLAFILISRMIDGFTGGNISVATSAIADISKPEDKTKNFGLLGAIFGVCFILGPFLGGILSSSQINPNFNLSTPFLVASFLSFINLILVGTIFKETLAQKIEKTVTLTTGLKNLKKAFLSEKYQTLFTVVFLTTLGFSFFTNFFQAYLVNKFQFNELEIGQLFAFVGIWIALTQGLIIRVIPKEFSPKKIVFFTCLTLGVSLFALTLPSERIYLFLILPFLSISNGLLGPNYQTIISNSTDKNAQGEIFGINNSVQAIGLSIAPLVSGFIFSFNNKLPLILSAILTILAGIVFKTKIYHKI